MANADRKSQSTRETLASYVQSFHAFHLVFFIIGLSIGVIISFYCKSFIFNLQITLPQSTSRLLLRPPPLSSAPPAQQPHLPDSGDHVGQSYTDDLELFWRASFVPRITEFPKNNRVPKIAFMFLTKGPIPLAPLWEMFFENHQDLYTIYVHTHPSYIDSWPQSSPFYRTRIPSKPVEWGKPTMIDAERRLLANALLDISNKRFVLLSETCVPLFNFTATYNYLMQHPNSSFVALYDDPRKVGRGRYNPRMAPTIRLEDWRKGSQWFEVNRRAAIEIVADAKYYPVFKQHCGPPCYMDEHYIPTLVNIIGAGQNSNRSVTWVDWSKSGPHPGRFGRSGVTIELMNRIRFGTNGTCDNGDDNVMTSSICFLFARKFMPDAIQPLLQIAPMLLGSIPQ